MIGKMSLPFLLLVLVLYIFLLAPLLIVVPLSFSNDQFLTFPPQSWGVRWYVEMVNYAKFTKGLQLSLLLACTVTAISLAVGIPAAYALMRFEFRGREALAALFTAPLLLPSIVLGLAVLLVFVRWRLLGSFPGLVLAHLLVTTPYVIRIMMTAFSTLPPSVEEAAAMLGASPLTVFRRVTLPLMRSGLVASAALSFLMSFDEVVISLFVTGPRLRTLPVEIFDYVESRTDPMAAAVSVALIVVTMTIIIVIERTLGLSRTVGKSQ